MVLDVVLDGSDFWHSSHLETNATSSLRHAFSRSHFQKSRSLIRVKLSREKRGDSRSFIRVKLSREKRGDAAVSHRLLSTVAQLDIKLRDIVDRK